MLVQRYTHDGRRFVNVTIHEEHAKRMAELINLVANKIGNDNPFGDIAVLLNFRDALHHARWGNAVHVALPNS